MKKMLLATLLLLNVSASYAYVTYYSNGTTSITDGGMTYYSDGSYEMRY